MGWIACSYKEPPPDPAFSFSVSNGDTYWQSEYVLVDNRLHDGTHQIKMGKLVKDYDGRKYWENDHGFELRDVRAWMPKPEPMGY